MTDTTSTPADRKTVAALPGSAAERFATSVAARYQRRRRMATS